MIGVDGLTRYELTLENSNGTTVLKVGSFAYLSDAINKIIQIAPAYGGRDSMYDLAKVKDSSFCYQSVYEQRLKKLDEV